MEYFFAMKIQVAIYIAIVNDAVYCVNLWLIAITAIAHSRRQRGKAHTSTEAVGNVRGRRRCQ